MIPYFILPAIAAIFCFVAVSASPKVGIYIGKSEYIRKQNLAMPIFFFVLLVLLCMRHESVGRDLHNYSSIFDSVTQGSFADALTDSLEPLYSVLCWVIGRLGGNFRHLLIAVAILSLLPVAKLYCEDREHSYLKIVLYLNMTTFVMLFSGLRQTIAIAIGMIAYSYVREKKFFRYVLLSLIALAFHQTAIMLAFMYPLYHMRFKRKHLFFIFPAMGLVFVFNKQIFLFLVGILARYSNLYEGVVLQSTGAFGSLILFALFALFAYLIPDETRMTPEHFGLRNFLFFAVALQCFAPIHNLAMRMNYYYIIFIPVLIPKLISISRPRYRQLAQIAGVVMAVFFTAMFIWTIYNSYVTGESQLNTVPYLPFWAEDV